MRGKGRGGQSGAGAGFPRPPGLHARAMARQASIEDQFRQIEEAVAALEGGELSLEESFARYEAGLRAVRQAKTQLDRYAAKLEELRAEPAGEPPAAG